MRDIRGRFLAGSGEIIYREGGVRSLVVLGVMLVGMGPADAITREEVLASLRDSGDGWGLKAILGFCVAALVFAITETDFYAAETTGKNHLEFDASPVDIDGNPDNDGLSTAEEREYGTDPFNPDTDGDGVRE